MRPAPLGSPLTLALLPLLSVPTSVAAQVGGPEGAQAGPQDAGWLLTPGFLFYAFDRVKVGANLDLWTPGQGRSESMLKIQSFFPF